LINDDITPGPELVRGYDPGSRVVRQLKRQWREMQTRFPQARAAKYDLFNFCTRRFGWPADPELRLLARLAPFSLAIDVGANWGQSVYALRRHARPARIIALEPNPELAGRLSHRFAADSTVEVRQLALGHTPGTAVLHVPRYRDYAMDGLASLDRAAAAGWLNAYRMARFDPALVSIDTCPSPVQRLDDMDLAPDLIVIDVQGTETAVAMGGAQTLCRTQPVIVVERPDDMFIHIAAKAGLTPYRWTGKRLARGDLTGKNTVFLAPHHLTALQGVTGSA